MPSKQKRTEFEELYEACLSGSLISKEVMDRAAQEALYLLMQEMRKNEKDYVRYLREGNPFCDNVLQDQKNHTAKLERLHACRVV